MTGENKLTIRDTGIMELVAKIEHEWLGSKDFEKHQAGFCSQWLLDNSCKYCANVAVSINTLSSDIHKQIPQVDLEEIWGGVWILLFFKVAPFEDKVSTILFYYFLGQLYLQNFPSLSCIFLSPTLFWWRKGCSSTKGKVQCGSISSDLHCT